MIGRQQRDDDSFWFPIAAAALLTAAAAIRFAALNQTFFEDEVWVALLFRNGGFRPHTFATPPLFYAVGRLWVVLRGTADAAMREPAAIFGVLTPALALLAPRPRTTRFVWAVLLAFSSPILFYSTRLKQYTLEAFACTLLILLLLRALQQPRPGRWVAFFAAACCAVLTLHSAVIICAAAGAVVVVTPRVRSARVLLVFAAVAALALFAYVAYDAPGPETVRLHGNMDAFFQEGGRWVDSVSGFARNSREWIGQSLNMVRFATWVLIPILCVWVIRRRDIPLIVLAAVPPLAVAGASVLHLYPYGEPRLMIFLFPAVYLAFADAFATVAERTPAILLLLIPFVFEGIAHDTYNAHYMHVVDLRATYETVTRGHRPGEPIYADLSYSAPLRYYYPSLGADLLSVRLSKPNGPGWYVQQSRTFAAPMAILEVRQGDVIAARVP